MQRERLPSHPRTGHSNPRGRLTVVAVALVVSGPAGAGPAAGQTSTYEPATEQRTRLLTDHADWFPDGSVVVSSNLTGSWKIWRVSPDGAFTALSDGVGSDDWPTVSPDGASVAFARMADGQNDVWVADGSGSLERRNLTNHPAQDIHPTWSADGTRILFNSNRDNGAPNEFSLWVMDSDGGNPRRLTEPGRTYTAASWSPDGRHIAYVHWPDGEGGAPPDVWIMPADGASPGWNVSAHPAFDGWPTWAPDGQHVVFASNRGGWFQIYRVGIDGGEVTRLVRSPYNDRRPFVSPDGTRLSFDRETQEARNILVVDVVRPTASGGGAGR